MWCDRVDGEGMIRVRASVDLIEVMPAKKTLTTSTKKECEGSGEDGNNIVVEHRNGLFVARQLHHHCPPRPWSPRRHLRALPSSTSLTSSLWTVLDKDEAHSNSDRLWHYPLSQLYNSNSSTSGPSLMFVASSMTKIASCLVVDPLSESLDLKLGSSKLLTLPPLPHQFRHKHEKGEIRGSSKFYSPQLSSIEKENSKSLASKRLSSSGHIRWQ